MAALGLALSGCADVWQFDDFPGESDATAPEGGDAAVPDGSTEGDAPSVDARPVDSAACPAAKDLTLDTVDGTFSVAPSGVDNYRFVLAQATGLLVRVHSDAAISTITIASQCDGGGAVLLDTQPGAHGSYARAALPAGPYFLQIHWTEAAPSTASYGLDVVRYATASNATCAAAAALTPSAALSGETYAATDTSTGCPPATAYGQLYYQVEIPPNAGWSITGTPYDPPTWNAWTMVVEAFSTCASKTCAQPIAMSPAPGMAASLTLINTSASPVDYLVGVSASAADAITGGGAFRVSAAPLSPCLIASGMACTAAGATGVCCAQACQPASPQNSCGKSCTTPCPVTGEVCVDGACACPTTAPTNCGGACVSTDTDANNCGACGHRCVNTDPHATGIACVAGACVPTCSAAFGVRCNGACTNVKSDPTNCGQCMTVCPAAETCQLGACACPSAAAPNYCGSACTDTKTDRANCGGCGHACPSAETCAGGVCTCQGAPRNTYCASGDVCTDVKTDPANCGACGNACLPSEVCQAGVCGCPATLPTLCLASKTCVDTLTDKSNCGVCGVSCSAAESCVNGICGCSAPADPDDCGGVCTNFQTDANNCGGCGMPCPMGQVCQGGACQCPAAMPDYCGQTCTNVTADPANCGVCGMPCGALQTCSAGNCTPMPL